MKNKVVQAVSASRSFPVRPGAWFAWISADKPEDQTLKAERQLIDFARR